ncbi:helicase HerA domain-containing protein [Microbispora bryophytorum]|uniref:helicase HerA domain-containing protein n=1 Tax=Microbispora bryophytorum TaxID=1460882 RepID=UPI00370FCC1D
MMTSDELDALRALRFNYTRVADDVWRPLPFHVEGIHRDAAQVILDGLLEAEESVAASPIGVAIQGQRGTGKTHLLGWVRQRVHEEDAYFFLVSLLDAKDFWESVLLSMLDSLSRPMAGDGSQLRELLWRLCVLAEVPQAARGPIIGDVPLSRADLDAFINALRRYDSHVGRDVQDTARALTLRASHDLAAQDIGDAYLISAPQGEPGERAEWGFRTVGKTPQEIVHDLSMLLALTGPSVIAVDQVDTLIAQSATLTGGGSAEDLEHHRTIESVAGGLMTLREMTRRTLTVLSCLPLTWTLIEEHATDTVQDRFRMTLPLRTIPDAKTGRALVEKRFSAQYGAVGFTPPYPTWPVKPEAFEEANQYTPRQLLIRIDKHVRSCLASEQVVELGRLTGSLPDVIVPIQPRLKPEPGFGVLDRRFAELRQRADVVEALDPITEDVVMPGLLSAGLSAWIAEQGEDGRLFAQDPPPSTKPPLHARLRRTLDEETENEAHWCFRSISASHHTAALNRLKTASTAAGLDERIPARKLFVLRNQSWAKGPATQQALAAFEQAGGRVLQVEEDDLRIFSALRTLLTENSPDLRAWLVSRKPTSEVKLFAEALSDAAVPRVSGTGMSARPSRSQDHPRRTANPERRLLRLEAVQGLTTLPVTEAPPLPSGDTPAADTPATDTRAADTRAADTPATAPGSAPFPAFDIAASPAPGAALSPAGASAAIPGGVTLGPSVPDLQVWPPLPFSEVSPVEAPAAEVPVMDMPVMDVPTVDASAVNMPTVDMPVEAPFAEMPAAEAAAVPRPRTPLPSDEGPEAPNLTIGAAISDGRPVHIQLETLRKHVAIFAGSGSGKTVLIRRLVEECALQGVSAIVLDANNDLARLGDRWPEPPAEWGEGDAARADDYLANTDVVIWTPRKESGRPLSFQPLPDFGSVADDPDEFGEAVDAALAALVPRAKLEAKTARAHLGQAVLREAVAHYGRRGGTGLGGLIALLDDLPDGVSSLEGAPRLATEMAQHLRAETISDPLFAGTGTPVDPGVLLTPPEGKRARVSVISLTGLASDAQRQGFVNQLQMALFSWIKRHPAGDRPLGGLFVMDEAQTFAPSGTATVCTQSTLALAAQARKYGLGLVFATQAPKGLHNRITGNAATQFFGLLNAPAQITAARELARAKGGDVPDVSRLRSGQFYAAFEGGSFTKVRTPLCLSHHPSSPLTSEEVVARANRS